MKVAIVTESGDADAIRGIGVYTRELVGELKKLKNKNFSVELVKKDSQKLKTFDILHYPDFRVYFSEPKFIEGIKTVVTVHDVIPLIYPKQYPPGLKGQIKLFNQKRILKKVDKIITVSETSKKDIVSFLGVPSDKIEVTYEAPRDYFNKVTVNDKKRLKITKKYNLPGEFILYVGDVNYNKNIPTLVEACRISGLPLVIVGKHAVDIGVREQGLQSVRGPRDWIRFILGTPHPELGHYERLKDLFSDNRVLRLGYVEDDDLAIIYKLASVYCQPSFYEGFGLSLLEAMASGCPTVISKTQALVEVADKASLIANPKNAKDMAFKFSEILKNENTKRDLVDRGFARVRNFGWEKTARETFTLYKELLHK